MSDIHLQPPSCSPADFRFGEVSSLTTFSRMSSRRCPHRWPPHRHVPGSSFGSFCSQRGHANPPAHFFSGSDNVLELNRTLETLSFQPSLGNSPNRGEVQPDLA